MNQQIKHRYTDALLLEGEKFGKLIAGRSFFQCGPIGSRSDYLQSFITDKGIVVKAGCFTGFVDDGREMRIA